MVKPAFRGRWLHLLSIESFFMICYDLSNLKVICLGEEIFEGHIMEMGLNNKAEHLSSLIILHNWYTF